MPSTLSGNAPPGKAPAGPSARDSAGAQTPPAVTSQKVVVPVDELIDGRRLCHPIHGREGVLLLAAGATISARFKELLRARGILDVLLHEVDAGATSTTS